MIQKWDNNLSHAISDLEDMISQEPDLIQQYLSQMDPMIWADESFHYVLTTVYNFSTHEPKKYFENVAADPHLGKAYYDRNLPIVQQRLIAGGVRLAQLLNTIFS